MRRRNNRNHRRRQHHMFWPFLLLVQAGFILVQQEGTVQEFVVSYSMTDFIQHQIASFSGRTFPREVILERHETPAERRVIFQDKSLAMTQASTVDLFTEEQDECIYKPWQTMSRPNCNEMHSLSMGDALYEAAWNRRNRPLTGLFEFFGHGGNRLAGKLALEDEVVVYKTGRYHLEYNDETFEFNRKEAIATEMLKGTTPDIYGYCGMLSVTEFADGGSMHRFRNDEGLEPLTMLNHAVDLSRAVAKIQSIDKDYVTLIHRDLETSNVIFVDDKPKIIDFHASLLIPWNATGNRPCLPYITASTKRADTLPPEMIRDAYQGAQIDVYGLGTLLFYLLTKGARLYHCERPKGICNFHAYTNTISELELRALKLNGTLPQLPIDVEESTDPAIEAIRDVTKSALHPDPEKRPSAREIAQQLERMQESLLIVQKLTRSGPSYSAFHGYTSKEEFLSRPQRFPSLDERVRIYMADWYTSPCSNNTEGFISFMRIQDDGGLTEPLFLIKEIEGRQVKPQVLLINSTDDSRTVWHLDKSNLDSMKAKNENCKKDFDKYVFPPFGQIVNNETLPTLIEIGDSRDWKAYVPSTGRNTVCPNIPFLRKYRLALNKTDIARLTRAGCHAGRRPVLGKYDEDYQPIIWLLRVERYYGMLPKIAKEDIPWKAKKDMAVFRSTGTGANIPRWNNFELPENKTTLDECLLVMAKCRLTYLYQNSSLVDAKVVSSSDEFWDRLYGQLQREGINLAGSPLQRHDMLKYKAIILLEGNDVSSGLKWALLSQSVVMMQPPTCTSWAMEELLEPWIHYIPLSQNLTDVEEKMQWVIDNDEEAERIAHRGSLWMKDLFFHRDSERDNQMILEEMARRYSNHFVRSPELIHQSVQ